jgi:hypothetical protein
MTKRVSKRRGIQKRLKKRGEIKITRRVSKRRVN